MWRKEQIEHDVSFQLGTTTLLLDYPTTGSGSRTPGSRTRCFDFVNENFAIDDQQTSNLVSYVSQADQGVAPGAQVAVQLNQATWLANRSEVSEFLLPQAVQRNIDLAVFGSFTLGGVVQLRWSWQRATGLFRAEDPAVPAKNLDFFLGQARTGQGDMVFVGLPVGTGDVFGIDRDDDGLLNKQEAAFSCNPEKRDTDGDGFSDGYEVANGSNPALASSLPVDTTPPVVTNLRRTWITSKVARLFWDTNEQTTFRIQYSTGGDPPLAVGSKELRKVNTALLTMMKPSSGPGLKNVYSGSLTVFDERGNATTVPLPAGIETLDGIFAADAQGHVAAPFSTLLGTLAWTQITKNTAAGTLTAKARARVDRKYVVVGAQQAPNKVVVASVIKNDVRQSGFTSPLPTSFTIDSRPAALRRPELRALEPDRRRRHRRPRVHDRRPGHGRQDRAERRGRRRRRPRALQPAGAELQHQRQPALRALEPARHAARGALGRAGLLSRARVGSVRAHGPHDTTTPLVEFARKCARSGVVAIDDLVVLRARCPDGTEHAERGGWCTNRCGTAHGLLGSQSQERRTDTAQAVEELELSKAIGRMA
jgi:hypothetical protein